MNLSMDKVILESTLAVNVHFCIQTDIYFNKMFHFR